MSEFSVNSSSKFHWFVDSFDEFVGFSIGIVDVIIGGTSSSFKSYASTSSSTIDENLLEITSIDYKQRQRHSIIQSNSRTTTFPACSYAETCSSSTISFQSLGESSWKVKQNSSSASLSIIVKKLPKKKDFSRYRVIPLVSPYIVLFVSKTKDFSFACVCVCFFYRLSFFYTRVLVYIRTAFSSSSDWCCHVSVLYSSEQT